MMYIESDGKRCVECSEFCFANTKQHLPLFGSLPLWLGNFGLCTIVHISHITVHSTADHA